MDIRRFRSNYDPRSQLSTPSYEVATMPTSDEARIRMLQSNVGYAPMRRCEDPNNDDFGLFEIEDTYEFLISTMFRECDGIGVALAEGNPGVKQQFKEARKDPHKQVEFPTVTINQMFPFKLVRQDSGVGISYRFGRADKGHENAGFTIAKSDNGHYALSNNSAKPVDMKNDEEYYKFIKKSQRWIETYAELLQLDVSSLINEARKGIVIPTARQQAGKAIVAATVGGGDVAKKVTKTLGRHKAAAGAAAGLALLLAAGQSPFVLAETIRDHTINRRHLTYEKYDARHIALPTGAATAIIEPIGSRFTPIPYTAANHSVLAAPNWGDDDGGGSGNGDLHNGSIRHLTVIDQFDASGKLVKYLGPKQCSNNFASNSTHFRNGDVLRVLNADAEVPSGTLALKISGPDVVEVCNVTNNRVASSGLKDVYVQFLTPK